MRTYIYDFLGHNPVGAFMYVRADDRAEADKLFKADLPNGLHKKNILANGDLNVVDVTEIKPGKRTHIISDGNY